MLKFKTNHREPYYIAILTYEEFLDYVSDNRNPDRNQEILEILANSSETSLMPTIWFNDSDCTEYSHVTYSTNTNNSTTNNCEWALYREEYDILKCPSIVLLLELHKD